MNTDYPIFAGAIPLGDLSANPTQLRGRKSGIGIIPPDIEPAEPQRRAKGPLDSRGLSVKALQARLRVELRDSPCKTDKWERAEAAIEMCIDQGIHAKYAILDAVIAIDQGIPWGLAAVVLDRRAGDNADRFRWYRDDNVGYELHKYRADPE